MGYFDPAVGVLLALIAGGLISFGLYNKRQIRRLDRIIAEKEAAMNAGDSPRSTAS
jgi:hypothetical protein